VFERLTVAMPTSPEVQGLIIQVGPRQEFGAPLLALM
jgi:hypothetical protein